MMHPHLDVTTADGVCRVRLTNPDERNAQTPSLWLALAEVARSITDDVRVVVLSGEGKDFSAGLHRGMLSPEGLPGEEGFIQMLSEGAADKIELLQAAFAQWRQIPAIVVAAVQGNAIGAGFQLALAADVRIVTESTRCAMREVSLGLIPDLGGTGALVEALGYSRALELCVTGRFMTADELVTSGLAMRAVPDGELTGAVEEFVGQLLATPAPAMKALKPLIREALTNTHAEQYGAERHTQTRLITEVFSKK